MTTPKNEPKEEILDAILRHHRNQSALRVKKVERQEQSRRRAELHKLKLYQVRQLPLRDEQTPNRRRISTKYKGNCEEKLAGKRAFPKEPSIQELREKEEEEQATRALLERQKIMIGLSMKYEYYMDPKNRKEINRLLEQPLEQTIESAQKDTKTNFHTEMKFQKREKIPEKQSVKSLKNLKKEKHQTEIQPYKHNKDPAKCNSKLNQNFNLKPKQSGTQISRNSYPQTRLPLRTAPPQVDRNPGNAKKKSSRAYVSSRQPSFLSSLKNAPPSPRQASPGTYFQEEEENSLDDFIEDHELSDPEAMKELQQLTGGYRYRPHDDGDIEEAGYDTIVAEEKRSRRIGIREDNIERSRSKFIG